MLLLFRSEALCEKKALTSKTVSCAWTSSWAPSSAPRMRCETHAMEDGCEGLSEQCQGWLAIKGKKRRVLTPTQKRTARFTQLIHIYFGSILTDISWYFSWYFWIEKKQRSLETRLATVQIRGFGRPRRASAWHRPLCSRLAWPRGAWCRWHRTGDNGCGSTRARAPWDLHGL